jgi:hypothetical protein
LARASSPKSGEKIGEAPSNHLGRRGTKVFGRRPPAKDRAAAAGSKEMRPK